MYRTTVKLKILKGFDLLNNRLVACVYMCIILYLSMSQNRNKSFSKFYFFILLTVF